MPEPVQILGWLDKLVSGQQKAVSISKAKDAWQTEAVYLPTAPCLIQEGKHLRKSRIFCMKRHLLRIFMAPANGTVAIPVLSERCHC